MQKKTRGGFSALIAAICIIIYLFAMAQAVYRFYLSIDKQKTIAEQEFSRIAGLALSSGLQGFMDERFINTMNSALATSSCIEALIISGPEGEYGFEKQQGRAITWVNNSPRFINRLNFSKQSHFKPLPIHDLRNANIKAVAVIFDYNEISKILKETLFLILAGFTIAFFTMLLQMLLGKPGEKTVYSPAQQYTAEKGKNKKETVIIKAEPAATAKGPKGLYSERSNIGWEEYTKDRLDSELHRCSSTENDLTLIMIEFTDITNDNMFRQAAEEAASFFSSRDLIFENGRQGITIILPGIDLYTGISRSEKFHQRIADKFPAGYNSGAGLCIGLSSRSGRLLNADRLLLETTEALEKAKSDPGSSIIAFKTDPEKYRAFISSQA